MKKKILLLSMLAISGMSVNAQHVDSQTDSIHEDFVQVDEVLLRPLQPTYLSRSKDGFGWNSNWFVETKGGCTAFLGNPVGCGDFFDRTSPVLQIGVGKWFNPSIGGRIEFQGMKFKNANQQMMSYQSVHADFMYNVTGTLGQNDEGISRWDLVPFAGVGIIRNADWRNGCCCPGVMSNNHPFAIDYGVQVGYRLTNRLHVIAEISGITTTRSFDAVGNSARFGDTMLNLSAGLSVTLGKAGWKKTVDASPYIRQNDYLMERCSMLEKQLDRCKNGEVEDGNAAMNAKNEYRGLLSLKMRLADQVADGTGVLNGDAYNDSDSNNFGMSDGIAKYIDVPVYFYFKLNSNELVDPSQLSNVDEIAAIAKRENLTINISGAADSATGTKAINNELSIKRAKYIAQEFVKRGVAKEQINAVSRGGINEFTPVEANRLTIVVLSR